MTLLDAHPSIAMSYELYPEMLELDDPSPEAVSALAAQLADAKDLRAATKDLEPGAVRTFIIRGQRSGTVNCDGYYSDGAIASPAWDLGQRDLRDFVRRWQPGRRYRVLTHPQYYGGPGGQPKHLFECEWYRSLVESDDPTGAEFWADVEPGSAP